MSDKISALPDEVLHHILSFLPSKLSVSTSLLSKRWKPLWRSVPSLDFDFDKDFINPNSSLGKAHSLFILSLCEFILLRNSNQAFLRFRLRCCSYYRDVTHVNPWLVTALQHRVEHLDLHGCERLPPALFCCKTLVVLNLSDLKIEYPLSSVDLPLLKILSLNAVHLSRHRDFTELLAGTPNIHNLEVTNLYFVHLNVYPLLPQHTERIMFMRQGYFTKLFEFPNLTHVKFDSLKYTLCCWFDVLQVLNRSPKLQTIAIYQPNTFEQHWFQQRVPLCMSLWHLRECSVANYSGSEWELAFVKYIMQSARVLRDVTIICNKMRTEREKIEMLAKLTLCTRLSPTCALSFRYD